MCECYTLRLEGAALHFVPCRDAAALPQGGLPPAGYELVSRLGDPALLHCAVFRQSGGAGGLFVVYDAGGPLFSALAESNLTYAHGLAHFGRMAADPRYGADIFADLDEDHD